MAVVTFFKDFLSVRKLELEIAKLRSDMEEKGKRVVLASPEEIQKFGRPSESPATDHVVRECFRLPVTPNPSLNRTHCGGPPFGL